MTTEQLRKQYEGKLNYYQNKLNGYLKSVRPEVLADPNNTFNWLVIGECKFKVKLYKQCLENL